MIAALLLAATAEAHRPHAVIPAVALPEDLASAESAWLVTNPGRISLLMRSVDQGAHWDYVGGPPTGDTLVGGATDGATVVFLAREGRLWQTGDDGASWTAGELPDPAESLALAVADGRFVVATDDGLRLGELDAVEQAAVAHAGTAFNAVALDAASPERVACVTAAGRVVASADGGDTWTTLATFPDASTAATAAWADGQLYAGTQTGVARRAGTAWVACGRLPVTATGEHAREVAALAASQDGRLLAATGRQAVFVSDDGCATWTLLEPGDELRPDYGGIGGAQDTYDAFTGLYADGASLVVAGWNGVAASADGGASWSFPKIIPSDSLRGLSVAPGFPDDARILIGLYGGGAAWYNGATATWAGSGVGITSPHAYEVEVGPTGTLHYAGLHALRSLDGGLTWEEVETGLGRTRIVRARGSLVFAMGEDTEGGIVGQVSLSEDDGATWTLLESASVALGGSTPQQVQVLPTPDGARWLITSDAPPGLMESDDRGASWTWLRRSTETDYLSAGVEAWPPGAPSRLVFANEWDGVLLSDDDGGTWRAPEGPFSGMPVALSQADDGTLFAGTRDARVHRSDDGGETWTSAASWLPASLHLVRPAPRFAELGMVFVASSAGVYWSNDGGERFHLLRRYERFEDETHHLDCDTLDGTECAYYEAEADGNAGGYAMGPGDRLAFSFHGTAFIVHGPRDGDGTVRVTLNGDELGRWSADGGPYAVDGLAEGWQDVVLDALEVGVAGFRVDLVEVWGAGEDLPMPGSPGDGSADTGGLPGSRCGCGGAAATGAWGLALALGALLRRTRRR